MNRHLPSAMATLLAGGLLGFQAPLLCAPADPGHASARLQNEVQAHTEALDQIDQQLARALVALEESPDPATAVALKAARDKANRIVFRLTQILGDGYPCQAVPLPPPPPLAAAQLPGPDEYVAFDAAPELVSMDSPEYPEMAREARNQGMVLVRVLVGLDGRVHDTKIIQSVKGLDEAALKSVRTAVFKPALRHKEPVAIWMVVPIEFSLNE